METLAKSLYDCTKAAVDQYIDQLVAAKLVSDRAAALTVWNSSTTEELKIADTPAKKAAAPKKTASTAPKKKTDDSGDVKKCQYVYVKGEKQGENCSSKVSEESETQSFCKKHLSHEKKVDDKKPAVKKEKTSSSAPSKATGAKKKTADSKEAEAAVISQLKNNNPVLSVKMNSFKNYEHEGTGLLFDRKTEEVYGRQLATGQVAPLSLDDLETCKRMGFKFRVPERLLSREDREDEEEEEIEESDDEDDEEEEEEEDD